MWERRGIWGRIKNCGRIEAYGRDQELWERMEDCGKARNCGREWWIVENRELWKSRSLWETQGFVGQCKELWETSRLLDNIGNYRRWDYGKPWRIVGGNGGF